MDREPRNSRRVGRRRRSGNPSFFGYFLASSLIGSIGVREIGLSLEGNSWLTRMWCDG